MKKKERKRITVRVKHRSEPDIRKLSRALIDLAVARAEADAQAAHHAGSMPATDSRTQQQGGRP